MIIDCHGHYTTASPKLQAYRDEQLRLFSEGEDTSIVKMASVSDDEIIDSVVNNQLKLIKERGGDLTIFSPKASAKVISRHQLRGRKSRTISYIGSVSFFQRTLHQDVSYLNRIVRRSSQRSMSYVDVLIWVSWGST
jgi:hypothetical protein